MLICLSNRLSNLYMYKYIISDEKSITRTMDENSGQIHVVLVPWAAFGHIMPMFQLSMALAKQGVHASLVSTPRNILKLPKLPPQLQTLIHLVSLPLPEDRHSLLPEGAEATVDIPFEKIQFLKKSYDLLKNPFKEFVSEKSPDWIISDCLTHWVAEVGLELNVPIIDFSVLSAASTVFFGPPEYHRTRTSPESMMVKPWWVNFQSKVAFRKHEALQMFHQSFNRDASGISSAERVAIVFDASKAKVIRSCPEFEPEFFDLQERISGKPAIPVGFLPPGKGSSSGIHDDDEWRSVFEWLEDQTPKSVFFVGFGSECKLKNDQIDTIARGLELSGVRFIWALQNGDGLPQDFISRVSKNGVVKMGWAPQREILGHPAIVGCLFHGGWGSVIETLQYGHCLVVLPFIIDQGLNARMLADKGLAIEVDRGEDGSFTEQGIADSLRKATALRARSEEAAAIFGDEELSDKYVEAFVKYMRMNGVKQ